MISRIAWKELRDMLRDGRFQLSAAIVGVLLAVSIGAGWTRYAAIETDHDAAQKAERINWLTQGRKNPDEGARYGVYAFQPYSQLSMIDTGIDPYVGVAVHLEGHKQNDFLFRPAQDGSTSIQRFGELTAAVVLQVIVPLVIILLAYAAFTCEREQGTLRQLLSAGVSRRQLAAGKATGIAAALAIVVIPSILIGVGTLAFSATSHLLSIDPSRALLMMAAYAVYFGVFIAMSLTVSALTPSSRVALVVLVSFWMVNGLIAARAFSDLGGYLHPTVSQVEFDDGVEHDLAAASRGARDAIFDEHFNSVFDQFDRQNRIYELGGIVSPLIAVRLISMGLAGTDFPHHRHFAAAAENYRRTIARYVDNDLLAHPTTGAREYLAGRELWIKVPEFEYEAPDAAWALSHYTLSVVVLAVWLVTSAAGALAAAERMAV